jgi:flavin reductase (DIM6/NTAB) family NADH-FMN oxidoreductase RutF
VIGKVKALSLEEAISVEPLLYFKGQYHSLPASIPGD